MMKNNGINLLKVVSNGKKKLIIKEKRLKFLEIIWKKKLIISLKLMKIVKIL